MHLDGTFIYIVLLVAVLVNIPAIWRSRSQLFSLLAVKILYVFLGYTMIASLWSANPIRAVVTAGFLTLLVLLVSAIIAQRKQLMGYTRGIKRIIFIPYYIVAAWSLWQIGGEAFGVPSSLTLLPNMYNADVFGIARPTGFALEPQFLASLLLPPLLWLVWRRIGVKYPTIPRIDTLTLIILSSLLVLTLSRGGILAFIVGLLCIAFLSSHNSIKRWAKTIGLLTLGSVVAFIVIFSFAEVNHSTNVSGYQSVSRVLNHLSFSVISLPAGADMPASTTPSTPKTKNRQSPGYIESSTDSRLSMSEHALKLWARDPATALLGVGTGGFGTALYEARQADNPGSIVNNMYIEQLVETGLIGLILLLAFGISLLIAVYKSRQFMMFPILVACLVQWSFFSGNANIIHVWVVFGIALAIVAATRNKTATMK
jgi:hypothetical protein